MNESLERKAREWVERAIAASCGGRRPDAVIVVPPFGPRHSPALGPHVLQAVCGENDSTRVAIVYANLLFASLAGESMISSLEAAPSGWLVGERVFAAVAHGLPPLGLDNGFGLFTSVAALQAEGVGIGAGMDCVIAVEALAAPFVRGVSRAVADSGVRVIGAACSYEQINAAVAILRRVKQLRGDCITVMGGANCSGPMADGIAELAPWVDHLFSGDSEVVFPAWLASGAPAGRIGRIVRFEAFMDLDFIPVPDFTDFMNQSGSGRQLLVSWETSRGCRQAQARQCRFCGLNAGEATFRQRRPLSALEGFKVLAHRYPNVRIAMTDSAMPGNYYDELLPFLSSISGLGEIHYEQRPTLGLQRACLLKRAGITEIQAGIEALSDGLLRIMGKGATAAGNIETLRLCRLTGIKVRWNLLCGFPGDESDDYEATTGLAGLISHLCPPTGLIPLALCRYSPYQVSPEEFGITELSPLPVYRHVLPPGFDSSKVCYFYQGNFRSVARESREVLKSLHREVEKWTMAWSSKSSAPVLHVRGLGDNFSMIDTRGLPDTPQFSTLSREQASAAVAGYKSVEPQGKAAIQWALNNRVAVMIGGRCVPLATSRPGIIAEFTGEALS